MSNLEYLKKISKKLYSMNESGSLSNLREIVGNASKSESNVFNNLAGYAHLTSFNLLREAREYSTRFFLEANNFTMVQKINNLIDFYNTQNYSYPKDRSNVDINFYYYCLQNNLAILKTLQVGIDSVRFCSWVYLVQDNDGVIKIYKEVLEISGPLSRFCNTEDELYLILPKNNFLPKYFGTVDVYGSKFIRQSVHFGQVLSLNQQFSFETCQSIIQGIAKAIQFLHSNNIAYLDIKPENFLINTNSVLMLDLGTARKVIASEEVNIYLSDPRFATPEGVTCLKASMSSDIFQLGILFYWLLVGHHPFELVPFKALDMDFDRESALLRYAWPTSILSFQEINHSQNVPYLRLIQRMLDQDPKMRPKIEEVIENINQAKEILTLQNIGQMRKKKDNTIIFPARMGIPHKGHIDYISRLLHLGYFVVISLQRSFTITDRDPIHKSFVMKMVAQSLVDQGFSPDYDFSFITTPYFSSKAEMEQHFVDLPQIQDVVLIASSNPSVHNLFKDWKILDQNSVFGCEGEDWQDLSWGEILRKSVKENDYQLFSQYAASGVEKILSFKELQSIYKEICIEFARSVEVVCCRNDIEISRGRIFRYQFPEQSIVSHLKSLLSYDVKVENLYSRDSKILVNGQPAILTYSKIEYDPEYQRESIFYDLTIIPSDT